MSQAIDRILRAGGFTADVFDSAEAALDSEVTPAADCLILDVHLPGISGLELYRRLADDGRQLPTVIITAHDEPAIRAESERLTSSNYLPKPFSGRALLAAVGQALRPQ